MYLKVWITEKAQNLLYGSGNRNARMQKLRHVNEIRVCLWFWGALLQRPSKRLPLMCFSDLV